MNSFSLYIHYPFCIKRCPYCGFATAVEKEDLAVKYREVLLLELKRCAEEEPWRDGVVRTIYFGGGTPSLMPPEFVNEVIELIGRLWQIDETGGRTLLSARSSTPVFHLADRGVRPPSTIFVPSGLERSGDLTGDTCQFTPYGLRTDRTYKSELDSAKARADRSVRPPETCGIEITLEANPETRDITAFRGFFEAGVNRISMGAQSFDPEELKLLGRAHSVDGVRQAVAMAREVGFKNLSLDLIYGVPGQTVESFRRSVEGVLELGVEHLSTYTLSIEEGTPFARSVKEKRLPYPDPDLMADQYEVLIELARSAGFEHYELTNYCKPGYHSRHNSVYWQRTPYLGVGCGAHSFDGVNRFWNRRDTRQHIAAVRSGNEPREGIESLNPADILQERLYLELRQSRGLSRDDEASLCKPDVVDLLIGEGFLVREKERLRVAEAKWLMLDEIVLRLQNAGK